MSKKPTPQVAETKPAPASAAFEQLPEVTKELLSLNQQLEKTTGPAGVVINQQINQRARQSPL